MADYWKSNPRKWCDFCKCWIEDNKPSIQFHEKGTKHKKAVEEHIRQARIRGIQKQQEDENVRKQLEAINKAALAAVGKDVENDFSRAQDSQYKAAVVSAQNQNSKSVEAPSSSSSGIKILERREERYDSRVTGTVSEAPAVEKAPKLAPAVIDQTTGLGVWQTVEVAEEDEEHDALEQQRIENMRGRIEAKAEKKRREKVVDFSTKDVPNFGESVGEPAAFKKRKGNVDNKRSIRRKVDSDDD